MRFIGSTLGTEVGDTTDFSDYWYENLCGTVRFDLAVRYARDCGADAFVELSAHPSLLYPLGGIVDDESSVIVGSGHRDQSITDSLSASIAAIATADPGLQVGRARSRLLTACCCGDSRTRRCGRCTCGRHRNA